MCLVLMVFVGNEGKVGNSGDPLYMCTDKTIPDLSKIPSQQGNVESPLDQRLFVSLKWTKISTLGKVAVHSQNVDFNLVASRQ